MQQARGYVYFEGKTPDEVRSAFGGFKLDSLELAFFDSLLRGNDRISEPGVFIAGQVDDRYSSADVVNLFRRQLGLEEGAGGCDISIESEDTLKSLVRGSLEGNYIGIRISPPHELNRVYALASGIADLIKAHDAFVRTVESKGGRPLACIELITKEGFGKYRAEVEQGISSGGLTLERYTLISLKG
jgi:hypothetical protein